jgi:hypothetical protein
VRILLFGWSFPPCTLDEKNARYSLLAGLCTRSRRYVKEFTIQDKSSLPKRKRVLQRSLFSRIWKNGWKDGEKKVYSNKKEVKKAIGIFFTSFFHRRFSHLRVNLSGSCPEKYA